MSLLGGGDDYLPGVDQRYRALLACPRCHGEWHAQVVGDDVKSLPLEPVLS